MRQILEAASGEQPIAFLIAARRKARMDLVDGIAARKRTQAEARARKKALDQPPAGAWLSWFDGATHPNPGRMGIGGVLQSPDGAIVEISFDAGHGDSSEAEYIALNAVLEAALRVQPEQLVIHGDSRVVIDDVQCKGTRQAIALAAQRARALQSIAQLKQVTLRWIPRRKNAQADALSQQALVRTTDRTASSA